MSGAVGGLVATTALVIAARFVPVIIEKIISIFGGFAANFLLSNFFVLRSKRADSK
jgi:putative flippase GtrA